MKQALLFWAACSCCMTAAMSQPSDGTLTELAQARSTSTQPTSRRVDERRPDQPFTIDLLGRPTELGGSYEITSERRGNFDLNAGSQRDRDVLDHEVKFDALMHASESVTVFAQVVGLVERRKDRSDGSTRRTRAIERGQGWVMAKNVASLPISMQLGRVAVTERRAWWWDDDLDAARVSLATEEWQLETGLAREVARMTTALPGIDPADRGVTRWFGSAGADWARRHRIETFWLAANDSSGSPSAGTLFTDGTEDASDARLRWFGLRASGEWRDETGHRINYRADAALLRGRERRSAFSDNGDGLLTAEAPTEHRLRGHAWDLGLQWRLPGEARPTFTLGWASGSGGAEGESLDRNFRQTGLQENKGRVAGVKRVRYYGELLDPELSNLRIGTVGFGLRFFDRSSAEVLLHQYRQQVASTRIAGSRLSEDPEGQSRSIGREIDFVISMREWRHAEVTLRVSRFQPGAGFNADRRDAATALEIGATLNF